MIIVSSVIMEAASIANAAFLAPPISTSPTRGFPPLIAYCSIMHLRFYFLYITFIYHNTYDITIKRRNNPYIRDTNTLLTLISLYTTTMEIVNVQIENQSICRYDRLIFNFFWTFLWLIQIIQRIYLRSVD